MTATIHLLPCFTRLDIEPDLVMEGAKGKLRSVLLFGRLEETDGFYIAASTPNRAELILLLEQAKHFLMKDLYEENL